MTTNKNMAQIAAKGFQTLHKIFAPVGAWLAVLVVLAGLCSPAWAQLDTGAVSGTVTDPSGKVVTGAAVAAHEVATGTNYATVTNNTGGYSFPSMHTGTYELKVSASGFKAVVYRGVVVSIGVHVAQDVTLSVGAATESVNVTAGTVSLEKESSDIDATISAEQVQDLPLAVSGNLRSLSVLEFLVPGAVGPGTSSGGSNFQMAKINGGQEEGTDYLVDGITTNRMQNGSGSFDIVSPSIEAVNEFHISLSGLPAELGRTTGGLANFNTRSGGNNYHGAVFDFYKNSALDGNNWFNNGYLKQATTAAARASLQRPADTKNNFGITLGGPVRIPHFYNGKDKTFFFFAWEQLRFSTGSSVTSILPTDSELNRDNSGYFDFSSTLGAQLSGASDTCNAKLYTGEIFDPQYENTVGLCHTTPFANNKIPVGRESAVAKAVLKYLPSPNLAGSTNNYVYSSADQLAQTVYSLRVDQNLNANHKVWAFYSSRENTDHGGGSNLPAPLTSSGGGAVDQLGKLFRTGWDWIATPSLVNSLTFGTNRSNNYNHSAATAMSSNWDQALGIANGSGPVFPGIVFSSSTNSFPSFGENDDAQDTDNTIALNDIAHWQHRSHAIKFGGEVQYHQFSFKSKIGGTCSGNAGCFTFSNNQTAADVSNSNNVNTGNAFVSFLLGQASDVNVLSQVHAPRWIAHYDALFIQDDWKLRPNLTINLGLRWSMDTPRHEAEGDTSNFDPTVPNTGAAGTLGALVFAGKGTGRNGSKNETWANVYRKDFEPRAGFAWGINGKDVLRGSGGIYYGPLVYADFGQGTLQGFTNSKDLFNSDSLAGESLDAGLPLLSLKANLDPTQSNGTGVDYIAKGNGKPAMVETWTLENQYQISPNTFVSVAYLGMHATRLHGLVDYPNDMPLADLQLGDCLWWWAYYPCPAQGSTNLNPPPFQPYAGFSCASGCTWGIGAQTQQALRPFPQYGYINMDSYLQNVGQSSYDALTVKAERKFHAGLQVLASYTFSKTLTDSDAIQPYYSTLQNQGGVQNPYNHKAEKAVSNEDIPQNFVISYLYELPIGKGKKFLANTPKPISAVISDWRISGVQRYMSGQPISFWGAYGIPGFDNGIRPNRVAGQKAKRSGSFNPFNFVPGVTGTSCADGFWNCAAFAEPNPSPAHYVPFTFGNMPRNSADIRGFKFLNEDFGFNKSIPIREGIKADFRGEMFNAFNRHVFNKPDSGLHDAAFGRVSSTLNGPRNVQFTLRITY